MKKCFFMEISDDMQPGKKSKTIGISFSLGLCISNEGKILNVYWKNILDNY